MRLWIVASFAMQPVAFVTEYAKGRARHIPPQTDPAVGSSLVSLCSLWRS